jgi:periplasmic protein TonB
MTRSLTIQNVVLGLLVAMTVALGAYLVRPQTMVRTAPVFYGEEVRVRTVAEPVVLVKPAPVSPALPLPIIPPSVTFKVLPEYPAAALQQGAQGTVLLSAYVGLTGKAEKIETKLSSGVKELDDAAAQAVAQWTFSPAAQGGAALASWFEVPVRFELK